MSTVATKTSKSEMTRAAIIGAALDIALAEGQLAALLAELRSHAPHSPALLLSDYDDAHIDAVALAAGAAGVVAPRHQRDQRERRDHPVAQALVRPRRARRPAGRLHAVASGLGAERPRQEQGHDRQHHRVQRVEPRQRQVAELVAALDRLHQLPPGAGRVVDVGQLDLGRPVAVLIPAQHEAGDRERQRQHEQQHAQPPHHLARPPVGAAHRGHHQVHADHQHDRRHAPAVDAAHDGAERHLIFDVRHRGPGGAGRRRVVQREQRARQRLDHQQEAEQEPQRVRERRAAGDRASPLGEHLAVAGALVEPVAQPRAHQAGFRSAPPFW